MEGFEKALGTVKVIKDQIQYRSQNLLNLARDYFESQNQIVRQGCHVYPTGQTNSFQLGQGSRINT